MGKIGFVFSGQGAQEVGMGQDVYHAFLAAKQIYDTGEEQIPGLLHLCFFGPKEKMNQTIHTQPLLYTTEIAIGQTLIEAGVHPHGLAGFSLGEMAALCMGGYYDFLQGLALVEKRAEFMQKATEHEKTSMMAILKLEETKLMELLEEIPQVYPVNFNGKGQIVVAGNLEGLEILEQKVKVEKGRCVKLSVSGGFHSPYMDQASKSFGEVLQHAKFSPGKLPVYSNYTAQVYGENPKEVLENQMNHCVLWEKTVLHMIEDGIDTFVEIGAGKTLVGLIKKIDPRVKVYSAIDEKTISEVIAHLKEI